MERPPFLYLCSSVLTDLAYHAVVPMRLQHSSTCRVLTSAYNRILHVQDLANLLSVSQKFTHIQLSEAFTSIQSYDCAGSSQLPVCIGLLGRCVVPVMSNLFRSFLIAGPG